MKNLKLGMVFFPLFLFLISCGGETPTGPDNPQAEMSIDIKDLPIVFNYDESSESWVANFTMVFKESNGVEVKISVIRTEARDGNELVEPKERDYPDKLKLPANGTIEKDWEFEVPDVDEGDFDRVVVIVYAVDNNAFSITERKTFQNIEFSQ